MAESTLNKLQALVFNLQKYITHLGSKWTVHSEAGKPMGTYDSEAGAKKRLGQIEYFKHRKFVDSLRDQAASLTKTEADRAYGEAISSPPVIDPSRLKQKPEQGNTINSHNNMPENQLPIITGRAIQRQRISGDSSGTGNNGPSGTGVN
jgi:hypothetical protein